MNNIKRMVQRMEINSKYQKKVFFDMYFPNIENPKDYIVVISHLINGVDELDCFDWVSIDNHTKDKNIYAIKKRVLESDLTPITIIEKD